MFHFWNVGAGYNEYNKATKTVRIVRWGFPGKNRRIDIEIPFSEIQSISIQTTNSFFFKMELHYNMKMVEKFHYYNQIKL